MYFIRLLICRLYPTLNALILGAFGSFSFVCICWNDTFIDFFFSSSTTELQTQQLSISTESLLTYFSAQLNMSLLLASTASTWSPFELPTTRIFWSWTKRTSMERLTNQKIRSLPWCKAWKLLRQKCQSSFSTSDIAQIKLSKFRFALANLNAFWNYWDYFRALQMVFCKQDLYIERIKISIKIKLNT